MSYTIYHLTGKEPVIERILRYSTYNGRKITLRIGDSVEIRGEWDGGTRTRTSFYNLAQEQSHDPRVKRPGFGEQGFGGSISYPLSDDIVAVEHTEGHWKALCIVATTATVEKYKLQPSSTSDQLGWAEKIVLVATKTWKANVHGNKLVRLNGAIGQVGITPEEWVKAKERLIIRGYLSKVGSFNIAGKNAVANETWNTIGPRPDDFLQSLEDTFREDPIVAHTKGATVRLSASGNEVEVQFPAKPVRTIIELLKKQHFRWGRGKWTRSVVADPQGVLERTKALLGITETSP